MTGELSGIILITAFAVTAAWCARIAVRLWRSGPASRRAGRD